MWGQHHMMWGTQSCNGDQNHMMWGTQNCNGGQNHMGTENCGKLLHFGTLVGRSRLMSTAVN